MIQCTKILSSFFIEPANHEMTSRGKALLISGIVLGALMVIAGSFALSAHLHTLPPSLSSLRSLSVLTFPGSIALIGGGGILMGASLLFLIYPRKHQKPTQSTLPKKYSPSLPFPNSKHGVLSNLAVAHQLKLKKEPQNEHSTNQLILLENCELSAQLLKSNEFLSLFYGEKASTLIYFFPNPANQTEILYYLGIDPPDESLYTVFTEEELFARYCSHVKTNVLNSLLEPGECYYFPVVNEKGKIDNDHPKQYDFFAKSSTDLPLEGIQSGEVGYKRILKEALPQKRFKSVSISEFAKRSAPVN